MRRAILDTSVFIGRETGRALRALPTGRQTAVSIVTIAELETGVLAAADATSRTLRLRTLHAAEATRPLPVTRTVAATFARLTITMRTNGLTRLKVQDAWIAATAIDQDAELWTQDGDFDEVPGLLVVRL